MRTLGICWNGLEQTYLDHIIQTTTRFPHEQFRYVEIGIAEGKTLAAVSDHLRIMNIPHSITGVDKEDGWSLNKAEVEKNMNEVLSLPTSTLNTFSVDYRGSVEFLCEQRKNLTEIHFLLIDGCHEMECAMLDFLLAEDLIPFGGIICFHDTDPGSQGQDVQPHHGKPIGVRDAITKLGLLMPLGDWQVILDVTEPPEGARGILMVRKV